MLSPLRAFLPGPFRFQPQHRPENCTQTVIANLLGAPIEDIERVAGTTGRMTVSETLALLRTVGVFCRPIAAELAVEFWPTFAKQHGGRRLRGLGFRLPRAGDDIGHAYLLVGSRIYDPATGKAQPITAERLRGLDWLGLVPPNAGAARALPPRLGVPQPA